MARALPEFVSRYLGEAASQGGLPSWLRSDFDDEDWIVCLPDGFSPNECVSSLTRTVSWNVLLPAGSLTAPQFKRLLDQCKHALIGASCLTEHGAEPTQYVPGFFRHIISFAEFLCVSQPREVCAKGLAAMSSASITAYVERYAEAGIVGTGFWRERWDRFVMSCVEPSQLGGVCLGVGVGCDPALSEAHVRAMREWLSANNWLESSGAIDCRKVAAAIRVDLRRFSSKAGRAFLRAHLGRYGPPLASSSYGPPSPASLRSVYNAFNKLKIVCAKSAALNALPVATVDLEMAIEARLRGHLRSRTKTLALPRLLRATEQAIQYIEEFGSPLVAHWEHLVAETERRIARDKRGRHRCLQEAFDTTEVPSILAPLSIRTLDATKAVKDARRCSAYPGNALSEQVRASLGLLDAISILRAATVFLTVFLTCSRLAEALSLDRNDLVTEHGRSYVRVKLRKRFQDGSRLRRTKPVPEVLHRGLSLVDRFSKAAAGFGFVHDSRARDRVFVEYGPKSVRPLSQPEVYCHLRLMMSLFMPEEVGDDGMQWYPRPHECRRAFAMSFFHLNGQEGTLPALSWIMGHECLEQTWRYIKEEMTGAEITRVEADLAFYAIGSVEKDKGARALEGALMKHFGVETLDIVDESEIKAYLELLHEQGYYHVKPHEVRTGSGSRYAVLTLVTGNKNYEQAC